MEHHRISGFLKTAAINLLLLVAGVVILELAFGSWFDPHKRMYNLSILRNTDVEYDVTGLYVTRTPRIRYTRDSYGLRGRYANYGEIDILTIGGSTTDQRYIADGQTWQDTLQEELRRAGHNLIVANAGVDGQSTYGHIKNFEWWFPFVPGLKPRYALFYIGLNDFCQNAGYALDSIERAPQGFSLRRTLNRYSALWNMGRKVDGMYRAVVTNRLGHESVDFSKVTWTDKPVQNSYDFMNPRLGAYRARLLRLIELCTGLGMTPIFVNQPSMRHRRVGDTLVGAADELDYDGHRYNGLDRYFMMQRMDSVMADVCSRERAAYIDVSTTTAWEPADFYDFYHLTPRGAAKVGAAMARGVAESGVLNR